MNHFPDDDSEAPFFDVRDARAQVLAIVFAFAMLAALVGMFAAGCYFLGKGLGLL